MHQLFIWVPTKGWKLVRRFKTVEKAREAAVEFHPLETKISSLGGSSEYGGMLCVPQYALDKVGAERVFAEGR